MSSLILKICNKVIEYSFYFLFFSIPLFFTANTSELFEFNKMWLTFGITIIIVASWFIVMIIRRKFYVQKTPLDIPILFFLLSQFVSTIFSMDRHVSVWGYYSRFNGGFLSLLSYVTLYYAFVTYYSENKNESTKKEKSWLARILLFVTACSLVVVGTMFAAPLPSSPTEGNVLIFFLFLFISFFLFTAALPYGFIKRVLFINLVAGFIVSAWALPSHFGFDPTCYLFRGKLDVMCWTESFQPKIRVFSTLGQPNWLAAYLSVLIPISLAFGIKTENSNIEAPNSKQYQLRFNRSQNTNNQNTKRLEHFNFGTLNLFRISNFGFLILATLFYVDIIFTDARSGILGLASGLFFFFLAILLIFKQQIRRFVFPFVSFVVLFILATFFFGSPLGFLRPFTYPEIAQKLESKNVKPAAPVVKPPEAPVGPARQQPEPQAMAGGPALETGGSESGKIRLNVWRGAIDGWKDNFLFGTGVETFAFAYYKYKPKEHNLTSEWDFLYNKAHNEYLNYLTTTGTFGLGTYVVVIGWFLWITLTKIAPSRHAELDSASIKIDSGSKAGMTKEECRILVLALLGSYITILVSNFFGFSVVIMNLYLFLIPAVVLGLLNMIPQTKFEPTSKSISVFQWIGILILLLTSYFILYTLYLYWQADVVYALGDNLDKIGSYERAYPQLKNAVGLRGDEPVFKDELSINEATLAILYAKQKDMQNAKTLGQNALALSNELNSEYPNNLVFLKTRVRVLSQLSELNEQYIIPAIETLEKAKELAPTDAKIAYNLGVLYGQTGQSDKGLTELKRAIYLRPNYFEAHYALGLFYHELSVNSKVVNQDYFQKGTEEMKYVITNFPVQSQGAKTALKSWGVE